MAWLSFPPPRGIARSGAQTETLEQELAQEEALAAQLEAEQASRDEADATAAAKRIESTEADAHLDVVSEKAIKGVDAILVPPPEGPKPRAQSPVRFAPCL